MENIKHNTKYLTFRNRVFSFLLNFVVNINGLRAQICF